MLLPDIYQLTWPTSFLGFEGVFNFVSFNYVNVLPVSCMGPPSWYTGAHWQSPHPGVQIPSPASRTRPP